MGVAVYATNKPAENRKTTQQRGVLPGETRVEAYERLREESKKVDAFSSIEEINQMVTYFLERGMFRTACFFVLGCNTGIRPSDLLEFEWWWVLNDQMQFCLAPGIVESKTGKLKTLVSNQAIKEAVEMYRDSCGGTVDLRSYMFTSHSNHVSRTPVAHRGRNKPTVYVLDGRVQPLNVRSISRDIRTAARALGLYRPERKISSYSMRSTNMCALAGLIDGRDVPDTAVKRLVGVELARMAGNHGRASTTMQHYLDYNMQRRQMEPAIRALNLGLEALLAFKQK